MIATTPSAADVLEFASTDVPCADEPDLWFSEHPTELEAAKRQCLTCPLAQKCLEGAISRREPWGVWGGQIVVDGIVRRRKNRRGRPRLKDFAA